MPGKNYPTENESSFFMYQNVYELEIYKKFYDMRQYGY